MTYLLILGVWLVLVGFAYLAYLAYLAVEYAMEGSR